MLHLELNLSKYIGVFADMFSGVRYKNKYMLTQRGVFSVEHNLVNYGLGDKFWLRYTDPVNDVDLIVYTHLRSYEGQARISFRDKELVSQFTVALNFDNADYILPDVIAWLRNRRESLQNDWFCAVTHEETARMFDDTERPKLYINQDAGVKHNTCLDASEHVQDTETSEPDLAISMQYQSQGDGYSLMVFLVSSETRNDRYCITVKSPSMLLNNLMLSYRRGFFGKFMQAITKEHRTSSSLSHLKSFRKLSRAKTQAVCVTLPVSESGIPDTQFRVGFVYDVVSRNTNIAGDEYLTLSVDGSDLDRHSKHFVVFN